MPETVEINISFDIIQPRHNVYITIGLQNLWEWEN